MDSPLLSVFPPLGYNAYMRSALTVFLVGSVVLLFLWFGKSGKGPSNIEEQVNALHKAEEQLVMPIMGEVAKAVRQFYMMEQRYPNNVQELIPRYLSSSACRDSWGHMIQLTPQASPGEGVQLLSVGQDGQPGTSDDKTMVVQ